MNNAKYLGAVVLALSSLGAVAGGNSPRGHPLDMGENIQWPEPAPKATWGWHSRDQMRQETMNRSAGDSQTQLDRTQEGYPTQQWGGQPKSRSEVKNMRDQAIQDDTLNQRADQ